MMEMDMQVDATGKPPGRPPTGSFGGHIIPGTFFILWALWWLRCLSRLHAARTLAPLTRKPQAASRASLPLFSFAGRPFPFFPFGSLRRSSRTSPNSSPSTSPRKFCCVSSSSDALAHGRMPWSALLEPLVIAGMTLVGIMIEMTAAHWRPYYDGELRSVNNLQHTTMYAGFGLGACATILSARTPVGRTLFPERTEFVLYTLAFFQEAMLFYMHVPHGTPENAIMQHWLLSMTIFACTIAGVWLSAMPHSFWAAVMLTYTVMLQGNWFWQIAFFEYYGDVPINPYMTTVILAFIWHMIGIAALFVGAFSFASLRSRKRSRRVSARLHHRPRNGLSGLVNDWAAGSDDVHSEPGQPLMGISTEGLTLKQQQQQQQQLQQHRETHDSSV